MFKLVTAVFVSVVFLIGCGGGESTPTTETINNNVPVAKISPVGIIEPNTSTTLIGDQSYDLDQDTLTYQWSITAKPDASTSSLENPQNKNASFIPDTIGQYEIKLKVNDGTVDSELTSIVIQVGEDFSNKKPSANAGKNATVAVDDTVNLDGSGSSDPEGVTLTYEWSFSSLPEGSSAVFSNANIVNPSFTTDIEGNYEILLVVSDSIDSSIADVVIVTAKNEISQEPNSAPVSIAGQNQNIKLNTLATLDGGGSYDPDSDSMYFSWRIISQPEDSSITLTNSNLIHPQFTPTTSGEYTFGLIVNDGKIDSMEDRVTIQVTSARTVSEIEPNNDIESSQLISEIGLGSPISASIDIALDEDWYRLAVIENKIYVIELYDVQNTFRDLAGRRCSSGNYNGLGIQLYDNSGTELSAQCSPIGSANVHTIFEFKAGFTGNYFIKIAANSSSSDAIGSYDLRILPDGKSEGATWDSITLEPNNNLNTAYNLAFGHENYKAVAIEERGVSFTTNRTDTDWYRLEANAGQSYSVELFDVAVGLAASAGNYCNTLNYIGLGLKIFNKDNIELEAQCYPQGAGNVHNVVSFKAGEAGSYYVQVASNNILSKDTGNYSIRILPKHDDLAATWDDVTHEPNDTRITAYEIKLGHENLLASKIIERNTSYATNLADIDWYRFDAIAGKSYAIELLNVDVSLAITTGRSCNTLNYVGLGLKVFNASNVELKAQCNPQGAGNVHNALEFKAGESGVYYVQVASNAKESSDYGSYDIRVLPTHDDLVATATWNVDSFEPNNIAINGYKIELGYDQALSSEIIARNSSYATNLMDIDWYRLEAEDNQIFVIELFDVSTSLLTTVGRSCNTINHRGLGLKVFNEVNVELKAQCNPIGAGNVHNALQFKAGDAGTYYIKVASNALTSNDSGTYSIRALPHYIDGATWDGITFEPNNDSPNAYLLELGATKGITSTIVGMNTSIAANRVDNDWYRISVVSGQTYIVDLYDVDTNLSIDIGRSCNNINHSGLGIKLFNSAVTVLKTQCFSNGENEVYSTLEFTAASDEVHYIQIIPNDGTSELSGEYSLRAYIKL